MFRLGSIVTVSGFILASVISSMILFAHADNINPGVFSTDSKPYNLSYGEWTAKWWQWADSIPQDVNPAADETGKNCAQKQNGPVWFLAGTVGGFAERTCKISSGKAILFPIIGSECSYAEYLSVRNKSELEVCAKADNNAVTNLEATVDGMKLLNLEKYRILSPLLDMTFPEDNPLGAPAGPTQMVSDGFYVFLEPLSAGKHDVHFSGTTVDNPTTGTTRLAIVVTYHLTVTP
jgi:hypothetical protein